MKKQKKYKGFSKRIEYLLARALISTLRSLPIGLAHPLGRGLGWLLWALLTARRRAVRTNLKIISDWAKQSGKGDLFEGLDRDEQVKEVFKRTGANILCGFSLSGMSQDELTQHVEFRGGKQLHDATRNGGGAILLLSHMGPWEALAHLPDLFKREGIENALGAVYRKFNNDYIEAWYKDLREGSGTVMFSSRYKFYAPVEFVRQGGILGVLSDQRASGGQVVDYFGRRTKATPLPGLIHLRAKAPWFALSLQTTGFTQWRITVHEVPSHLAGADRSRDALAQTSAQACEHSLSQSILDGFWINNRFRDSDKYEHTRNTDAGT